MNGGYSQGGASSFQDEGGNKCCHPSPPPNETLASYSIAVNFRGRNILQINTMVGSDNFLEKTFTYTLKPITGGYGKLSIFAEKTFKDYSQTSKSMKVLSLEYLRELALLTTLLPPK